MRYDPPPRIAFAQRLAVVVLGLLAAGDVVGQVQDRSPFDLVDFLTYQGGRPSRPQSPLFSCGIDAQGFADRAATNSLTDLGAKAIPALEKAFDSIEKEGWRSPFAVNGRWLLYAYAKIKGPAAFPRLWRMATNPTLEGLFGINLDDSLALSFSLTSYMSSFNPPLPITHCHIEQPRDALNHFILAWERNDRSWMEAGLGPHGKDALISLLEARTWSELRAELWPDGSSAVVAVGYRLRIPSPWSEPELALESYRDVHTTESPELDTEFKNKSGGDCGRHRVKFLKAPVSEPPGYLEYLVDDSDLAGLLRLIGTCAAQ